MRIAGFAILLLPALLACQGPAESPAAGPTAQEIEQLLSRAPGFGRLVRAAMTCNLPMSATSRDRAERIELAALELLRAQGGHAASETYLRGVQPPAFEPRQRGRDRTSWCASQRAEVDRADAFLIAPDGALLAERADAIRGPAAR